MTLMSTRHFIQNNKNLKSQKPITIIKGEQFISGNTSHWCPVYILNIFHLSFIIRPTKCILIKSSLIGDNLKEYTDAAVIKDSQLYNFVLILMSNIDNIIADSQHEMKVKAEVVDFILYFNTRMDFKCLINSPFFQIGYIDSIGLVFKQTRRGVSMVNVVGRPIVTMGPFNVGVFGYIHKKMSNDENRREIQNWFKEVYELSKHSNKNQLTVIAYDWTIGELAKSPEEVRVMLIKALLKDYCISEEVFKSVCQYVNDPIEQKRDLGANKCNEVSHPGGDFDGDTYNPYNFLEMEIKLHDKAYAAVVDSCESVSPNPRIKDTKMPNLNTDFNGLVVNFEINDEGGTYLESVTNGFDRETKPKEKTRDIFGDWANDPFNFPENSKEFAINKIMFNDSPWSFREVLLAGAKHKAVEKSFPIWKLIVGDDSKRAFLKIMLEKYGSNSIGSAFFHDQLSIVKTEDEVLAIQYKGYDVAYFYEWKHMLTWLADVNHYVHVAETYNGLLKNQHKPLRYIFTEKGPEWVNTSTKSKLTVFMDSVLPEHSSDFFVKIGFLDFMNNVNMKSNIIDTIKKGLKIHDIGALNIMTMKNLPVSITITIYDVMNKPSELVVKLIYNGNGLQGITEEFFKKDYVSFDRQTVLKDIVEAFDEKNNYSVLTNKISNRIKEYIERERKVAMAASNTKTASTMDDIISMASVVKYIKNNCVSGKIDFVQEYTFKETARRCTHYLFDSHQLKKAFHKPIPTCDKVDYMLVESSKTDTMYVDYILFQDGRPILRNNEIGKVLEKIISIIND